MHEMGREKRMYLTVTGLLLQQVHISYFVKINNFLKRNIKRGKQKSNEDLELAALQIFRIYVVESKSSQNSGVKLKYSSLITLEVHPSYVCACMHVHAHVDTCTLALSFVVLGSTCATPSWKWCTG
jgi:hypothetical protein